MTHEEVYQELERERDAVTRWWRHQLDDYRRRALKCTRFPMHIWREYTSARKNRYVFFSRVFNKRMKTILTGVAVIRHTSEGLTVYTTWLSGQRLISPMVLTPHMWKRYAERAKVGEHGIELIKHYFLNNPHGMDSDNQRVVGRSVRWNGEDHLSCCVPEGVLLGQEFDKYYLVRTFITYDMTTGMQQAEFEDKRSQIITDRDMYERIKMFYQK
jgi:phage/plasmid-associated DNA primase